MGGAVISLTGGPMAMAFGSVKDDNDDDDVVLQVVVKQCMYVHIYEREMKSREIYRGMNVVQKVTKTKEKDPEIHTHTHTILFLFLSLSVSFSPSIPGGGILK